MNLYNTLHHCLQRNKYIDEYHNKHAFAFRYGPTASQESHAEYEPPSRDEGVRGWLQQGWDIQTVCVHTCTTGQDQNLVFIDQNKNSKTQACSPKELKCE